MRKLAILAGGILLATVSFVAAWVLNTNLSAQTYQNALAAEVAATVTAVEEQRLRSAPILLNPPDAGVFDNAAAVKLEWDWIRPLADDEVFDVRVWHDGDPAYGITWTQDKNFDLTQWLLYQQPGDFFWSISVLKKGEPAIEISDVASPRLLSFSY